MPDGWAWCRLSNACSILMGQSPEGTSVSNNTNGMEFHQGKIFFTNKYLAESGSYTAEITRIAPESSLLLCVRAPVGVVNITKREICIGRGLCAIKPNYIIDENFWFYWIQCLKADFEQKATGTTFKAISVDIIKQQLIPLPPLLEQQLIINTIERIFSHIENLEKEKNDLQNIIKQTKSKILDLAIHGKLVSQDPNDEPAEELLKRIATSDNRPYKKFEEEEPFEIPSNWSWCFLGDICSKIKRGKSPKYVDKSTIMAFAQKCNQKDGPTSLDKALYIDETTLKKYPEEEKMQFNDIVINSTGTGTLGRVGIFNCSIPNDVNAVYPDSHVTTVRILPEIDKLYCYYFIKNKQSYLETIGEGSTNQKELKPDTISSLCFPLPPYPEQKRIVFKIEELFSSLETIVSNLD